MKKNLMATTGIVAALAAFAMVAPVPTMAAEKKPAENVKIGIHGSLEQWFGFVDADNDGANGVAGDVNLDQRSDNEIHFAGSTTLDNGLGIALEFEVGADVADHAIDEASLTVSGAFGSLTLGENDGAPDRGSFHGGMAGIGLGDGNDWVRAPTGFAHAMNDTVGLDLGFGDSHNLTYITPSMNGLQFGMSYFPSSGSSAGLVTEAAGAHNGLGLSVTYNGAVGKNAFKFSTNYMESEAADDNSLPASDPWGIQVGAEIVAGAVTVGAAFLQEKFVSSTSVATEVTNRTYEVTLKYADGANLYSVGYLSGNAKVTGNEDKWDVMQIAYDRNLSGGVTWASTFGRSEFDGNGTGGAEDNEGTYIVTGLKVSF